MRPYEVMIIFDVDLEEADIRERVDRLTDLVKSHSGTAGRVDFWGRRTFAYEMKHRTEGFYVLVELTAEPPTVAEVDRLLTLEDAVLRHKVIRLPEHVAGRTRPSHRRSSGDEGSRSSHSTGGNGAKAPSEPAAIAAEAAPVAAAEPAAN
jgi:small subunit ribosomal protein S6